MDNQGQEKLVLEHCNLILIILYPLIIRYFFLIIIIRKKKLLYNCKTTTITYIN